MKSLGVSKKIGKMASDCDADLADMSTEILHLICLEICQPVLKNGEPSFEVVSDGQ